VPGEADTEHGNGIEVQTSLNVSNCCPTATGCDVSVQFVSAPRWFHFASTSPGFCIYIHTHTKYLCGPVGGMLVGHTRHRPLYMIRLEGDKTGHGCVIVCEAVKL